MLGPWEDEEELLQRSYDLVHEPHLRRRFGNIAYNYCRAVHDEKPVAERFLKLAGA